GRLATAMQELNARLRVHGLSDAEAAQLPVQLDVETIGRMEISTWRTDAGRMDVLVDRPGGDGRHRAYEELLGSAHQVDPDGVWVAGLDDIIASKEWADRPKDHDALPELYRLDGRLRRPGPDAITEPGE
ncbi:MAG: hypothetical protein ACRDZY_22560, partial [Acidimicrobiales bacterium]